MRLTHSLRTVQGHLKCDSLLYMRKLILIAILFTALLDVFLFTRRASEVTIPGPSVQVLETIQISKPEIPFTTYNAPKLPKQTAYRVFLLGDSMTEALGPYTDRLREVVKEKYKDIDLIIENHSAPSSNIESIQERLLAKSRQSNVTFEPILGREFDILIIESFGYNPLSHLGTTEGLTKQKESLTNAMKILVRERPNALIIFLATIAPSRTHYGIGSVKLTPQQRNEWANERALYIQNHIQFAKDHNIPLVDVYSQTLNANNSGLLKYINPTDYIHPSQEGVIFIQDELAKFLIQNQIFE